MSLDLSTLSPKARHDYILTGRQFGSPDTLAQANQTLQGLATHGAELVQHGFAADDVEYLKGARDALVEAGVGRHEARGDKKVTNATYVAAMKAAKTARESARTVLIGTRRILHEKTEPAAEAAVQKIDAALQQTRSADGDALKLIEQLGLLRSALEQPTVASAAAARGGPQAVADLQARATALQAAAAARAGALGTPAETEHLDLLDGIVVYLTRTALKAARAAAKRLGKPSLVADFELTKLYEPRLGTAPAPEPAPNGASNGAITASPAPSAPSVG